MYEMNGIVLNVIRTWTHVSNDEKDGMMMFELQSPDGRYSLITDSETVSSLTLVQN